MCVFTCRGAWQVQGDSQWIIDLPFEVLTHLPFKRDKTWFDASELVATVSLCLHLFVSYDFPVRLNAVRVDNTHVLNRWLYLSNLTTVSSKISRPGGIKPMTLLEVLWLIINNWLCWGILNLLEALVCLEVLRFPVKHKPEEFLNMSGKTEMFIRHPSMEMQGTDMEPHLPTLRKDSSKKHSFLHSDA